jgi:hypothetical protein
MPVAEKRLRLDLRAGEWVEVRSKEEILATLDPHGRLDNLPFQPEMFGLCGQRLRVWKVAHKTCDTIHKTGGRKMNDAVHLEGVRCDGSAHGGCQANCLLFWKEAWLKRVGDDAAAPAGSPACSEADIRRAVTAHDGSTAGEPTWVCQITSLFKATAALPWWDARQYLRDVTSGNYSAWHMARILFAAGYRKLVDIGVGYRALILLYNRWQKLWGGKPYPLADGMIPKGQPTPTGALGLQVGESVEVLPVDEIRATLGPDSRNRGLLFDPEMAKFCGERHRVLRRVERLIDEPTGKMVYMKNPCIVLKDVYCRGECTPRRLGCPRAIDSYWREIWLRRV